MKAASAAGDGPLSSFRMTDKDRYELKIAGLLHDCGKITTPVHVVDKATKLQTIYDRIGLLDTRFEALKREAEVAMLRAVLAARGAQDAEFVTMATTGFSRWNRSRSACHATESRPSRYRLKPIASNGRW